MLFLINLYIAVFFSALLNSVYGIPQYAHQLAIFSTLSFFFSVLCFLTLWLYLKQFFEESAITHIVTTFISAGIAIYSGALILNFHRPIIFLVTGNGVYSADVPDYINVSIDFFCIFSLCAATLFSKWSRTRKLGFLCCVLHPVLFSVLSMNLYVSNNGVSILGLLNIVVILPICLIFFNANDELEKDLLRREKQQTELQVSAMHRCNLISYITLWQSLRLYVKRIQHLPRRPLMLLQTIFVKISALRIKMSPSHFRKSLAI